MVEERKVIVTVVGKDGRITIPSDIRKQHDIKEGDIIRFDSKGQGLIIEVDVIYNEK